jgi:hypothetical protein
MAPLTLFSFYRRSLTTRRDGTSVLCHDRVQALRERDSPREDQELQRQRDHRCERPCVVERCVNL